MKTADRLQTLVTQLGQQKQQIGYAEQVINNKRAWVESAQNDLKEAQAVCTTMRAEYVATLAKLRKLTDELGTENGNQSQP